MKRWGMGILAITLIGGCATDGELDFKPEKDDTKQDWLDAKEEAWGPSDTPGTFSSSLEYRFASLPAQGEAQNIPWAGNYWPTHQDNINFKWAGATSQAASTKYGQAFGVTGVEAAVSQFHGIDSNTGRKACTTNADCTDQKDGSTCAKRDGQTSGRCIPTWWGICHAWAPLAVMHAEPKYPVTHNGVTFAVQDIKALMTLAHNSTNTKFVSLRCNQNLEGDSEIVFDNYGRPIAGSAACIDTNAGTMHLLLANFLGVQKQSFVEDRTFDDEVWNQPLRGYKVLSQAEVTSSQANALIGVTSVGGTTVAKSGTVVKDAWAHQGSFAVSAGQLLKVSMKGTGDADLYVKFGAQPTAAAYDCRPFDNGTLETCELTVPAGATQAFVSVNGYAATSNYELQIVSGGSVPAQYVFNANAVKFFHLRTQVDYISESSAQTDGFLGNRINDFTNSDTYEYILEVDAAGKIIGGEWIGGSKTSHPDFLWLPISVGTTSVAGGKITYARVKQLYDLSLVPPGGTPPPPGSEKTVNEAGTVAKNAWKHYGPFNVAAGKTLTATLSGDGDADLYVRKGAAPTLTSYDCRPYQGGTAESCSVVGGGAVYVSVNGYATSSTFALAITYTEGTGTTPPVDPPASVTHLNVSGSVALNEMKPFQVNVIAGQKIVVKTTSAKDIDLYVQLGAAPTATAYLARGYTSSGNETVTVTPTSSGTLFIAVHGYEAASFTLKTSDN